jgi:ribosomal protein S18 acetylase RimI-like enzyme
MIDELVKQLTGYEIKIITKQNFEMVFEIYDSNQDFFLLTQGKIATIESSIDDVVSTPPDFDLKQKIYIGIWENGKVIGVLDLLKGYPKQAYIWIGLLLIHGKLHNKKIGSKIVDAVIEASKIAEYEFIQLGVIENNVVGLEFWQKHGFSKVRVKDSIVVMEKRISNNCKE